ncbi:hypothetical protein ACFYO0_26220 [Streptomyces sp. NPDC006365]|uniref:hypothetical protein n=1 Tax=Streptomyces sp. NPDC006365 TaxID=3364744 RepID=UPI0036C07472
MSRPIRTIAAAVTAVLLATACNSASSAGSSAAEDSVRAGRHRLEHGRRASWGPYP